MRKSFKNIALTEHIGSKTVACILLGCIMLFSGMPLASQVINNKGAAISIHGATVTSTDFTTSATGSTDNKGTVKLSGNWENDGALSPDTGTFLFESSTNQLITKAGTATEQFHNFKIKNTGDSVTLNNPIIITGIADFNAGKISTTNDIEMRGNVVCGSGVMSASSNTVSYAGAVSPVLSGTYYNLTLRGTSTKAICGNVTVLNNLTVEGGGLEIGPYNLTVYGETSISGSLTDNDATGQNTFGGKVTIDAGASWNTTPVAASGQLIFKSGIENNGTFDAGGAMMSANNQTLSGTGQYVFNNNVVIDGIEINNSANVEIKGSLDGVPSGFTELWQQTTGAELRYGGTAKPMDNGTFDASALLNTVTYNGNVQLIGGNPNNAYYNLILSNTGTKSTSGALLVTGDFSMSGSAQLELSPGNNFELSGNWLNTSSNPTPLMAGGQMVTFNGTATQQIQNKRPASYSDLTINNAAGVYLSDSDIIIINKLTLTQGNITSNSEKVAVTNGATNDAINRISGHIIGNLQRHINATATYSFQVGTTANYNPLVAKFTDLTSGDYLVRFETGSPGSNGLPLHDGVVEVFETDSTGFWYTCAVNGLASADYTVVLNTTAFGVDASSRIVKKENDTLKLDGINGTFTSTTIGRKNLSGGLSTNYTTFAIGQGRPFIVTQPSDITICEGLDTTFSMAATGQGTLSYQWQVDKGDGAGFTNIVDGGQYSNVTTNVLTISNNSLDLNNYAYRCIVTDAQGHPNISNTGKLTVNPTPVITLTQTTDTICNHTSFAVDTATSVAGSHYSWTFIEDAGITGGVAGSGFVFTDTLHNSIDDAAKVEYTLMPVSDKGCEGPTITYTVWVEPTAKVAPQPALDSICDNTYTAITLTSPTTPTRPVTFRYSVAMPAGVSIVEGDTTNLSEGFMIADKLDNETDTAKQVAFIITPYTLEAFGTTEKCAGTPDTAYVWVNPTPKAFISADTTIICTNSGANLTISSPSVFTSGNIQFAIAASGTAGVAGYTSSTESNGYVINDVLTNTTDTVQTVTYQITPQAGTTGCSDGPTVTTIVKVNPTPRLTIAAVPNDTMCFDENIAFTVLNKNKGQYGNFVYDVAFTTSSDSVLGATTASDINTMFVQNNIVNTSDTIQWIDYSFTPKTKNPSTGIAYCNDGEAQTYRVHLNPQPRVHIAFNRDTLCYNEGVTFTVTNGNKDNSGTWAYDVTVTKSVTSGIANITTPVGRKSTSFTQSLVNNTFSYQWVEYTFTPRILNPRSGKPDCANGIAFTKRIYINPRPKIDIDAKDTLCFSEGTNFAITNPNTVIGTWKYNISITVSDTLAVEGYRYGNDIALLNFTDSLRNTSTSLQWVEYTFTPRIYKPGENKDYCENGVARKLKIYINPMPSFTAAVSEEVLCSNHLLTMNFTSHNATLIGQRYYTLSTSYNPAAVTGVHNNGDAVLANFTDSLSNLTDSAQTISYRLIARIKEPNGQFCNSGTDTTILVYLEPHPRVFIAKRTDTICSASTVALPVSSITQPHAGIRFRYTSVAENTATVAGLETSKDSVMVGDTIVDMLTNLTDTAQLVKFVFTPYLIDSLGVETCANGFNDSVYVWVEPRPKVLATPATDTLCNENTTSIQLTSVTGSTAGIRFAYTSMGSIPGLGNGSKLLKKNDFIVEKLTNNTNRWQMVTYTIVPWTLDKNGNLDCSGDTVQNIVYVEPTPQLLVSVADTIVCDSANIAFAVTDLNASTIGIKQYTLQVSNPGGVLGVETNTSFGRTDSIQNKLINTSDTVQVVTYRFVAVMQEAGNVCSTGTDTSIRIYVNPTPYLSVNLSDAVVCDSGQVMVTVTSLTSAVEGSKIYLLTSTATGGVAGFQPSGEYAEGTDFTNNLYNPTDTVQTVTYRFKALIKDTRTGGYDYCNNGNDTTLLVRVNPTPRISVTSSVSELCNNTPVLFNIGDLNLGKVSGTQAYIIQISKTDAAVTGNRLAGEYNYAGNLAFTDTINNPTQEVQKVTYTFKPVIKAMAGTDVSYCLNAASISVTLTINPTPSIRVSIPDTVICNDKNALIAVKSNNPKVNGLKVYQLYTSFTGGVSGVSDSGEFKTSVVVNDLLHNPTDTFQNIDYNFVAKIKYGSLYCANGTNTTIHVKLEPTPYVNFSALADTLGNAQKVNIKLSTPSVATSGIRFKYSIINTSPDSVSIAIRKDYNLAPGEIISDTLRNSGNIWKDVSYIVTPYSLNTSMIEKCEGLADTFKVVVNPTPVIYFNPILSTVDAGDINSDKVICDSGFVTFTMRTPSVTTGEVQYALTTSFDNTAVKGIRKDSVYAMADFTNTMYNSALSFKTISYNFKAIVHNFRHNTDFVNGRDTTIAIDVNPLPRLNFSSSDTMYCNSSNVRFNINSGNGSVRGVKYFRVETTYNTDSLESNGLNAGIVPLDSFNSTFVNKSQTLQAIQYRLMPVIRNPRSANPDAYCANGVDTVFTRYILPQLNAELSAKDFHGYNEPCFGNKLGEIYLKLSGGLTVQGMLPSEASYHWLNSDTTQNLVAQPAGIYPVDVIDQHLCTAHAEIELTQPAKLKVSIDQLVLGSCTGAANQQIPLLAIPTDGTPGYMSDWYLGGIFQNHGDTLPNAIDNTYTVVVKDLNKCEATASKEVSLGIGDISVDYESSQYGVLSVDGSYYNISCPGKDDGFITPSYFDPKLYTINWTYRANIDSDKISIPYWDKGIVKYLKKGIYAIEVQDINNVECSGSAEITLVEPDSAIVTTNVSEFYDSSFNISCHNSKDGIVELLVNGGHGRYKYSWTMGDSLLTAKTNKLTNLDAGQYNTTVFDTCFLRNRSSLSLVKDTNRVRYCPYYTSVTLTKPDSLTFANVTKTDVNCFGDSTGSLTVELSGGVGAYTYNWTAIGSGRVFDNSKSITRLNAGNYSLTVNYGEQCTATNNYSIKQPLPITDTAEISKYDVLHNISCSDAKDGSVNVTVAGGYAPYSFAWVNTSNTANLIGSNNLLNGVGFGTYKLTVTDSKNCLYTNQYTLTAPNEMHITPDAHNLGCNSNNSGWAQVLKVTGGIPYPDSLYTYSWSTSDNDTLPRKDGLAMGSYYVIVKARYNCDDTAFVTISEPDPLVASLGIAQQYNGQDISCYGLADASIKASVTGGNKPYRYFWSDKPSEPTSDSLRSNLPAGTYKVLAVDTTNCKSIDSLIVTQPEKMLLAISTTNVLCFDNTNGTAIASATGGTTPYNFIWNNGINNANAGNIAAGSYSVSLTDANNCNLDSSITITQPELLVSTNTLVQNPYCPDLEDGSIRINPKGGTLPYEILWSNGMSGDSVSHLDEGDFVYTVIDSNNCQYADTITLNAQEPACLYVPVAFSPNGDSDNPTWDIEAGDIKAPLKLGQLYPKATIEVFSRWGNIIYKSDKGYPKAWDGSYKGRKIPMDSYYYSLDLGTGAKKIVGIVSIIR